MIANLPEAGVTCNSSCNGFVSQQGPASKLNKLLRESVFVVCMQHRIVVGSCQSCSGLFLDKAAELTITLCLFFFEVMVIGG